MKSLAITFATTIICTTANAGILIAFDEGAPKDRFTIQNMNGCALDGATLTLDLSQSKAGLIFDVTGQGAGVNVFQPFELTEGAQYLSAVPMVRDGDNIVALSLKQLPAGEKISFTVDVDDTIGQREITVSGSEIAGAAVLLSKDGRQRSAIFGTDARAVLNDC